MSVKPIPEGYHTITAQLNIDGAAAAIDFYVEAFGAEEEGRMAMPDGSIAHAAIRVHDAPVYLADAPADMPGDAGSPTKLGGSTVMVMQYVADVDAVVARAEQAGATVVRAPEDQFYGDRSSMIVDPFGHHWAFHTHIREVGPEEMQQAMEQAMEQTG